MSNKKDMNLNLEPKSTKLLLGVGFVLIMIFFALILGTTVFKNVNKEFVFEETVLVSGESTSVKIGNLNINNYGFLPARVSLNGFFACSFDENSGFENIELSVVAPDKTYYFYSYSNPSAYFDISAGSNQDLSIILEAYGLSRLIDPIEAKEISGDLISSDIYIFDLDLDKVEVEYNYRDLCPTVTKDDAIAKVFIEVI